MHQPHYIITLASIYVLSHSSVWNQCFSVTLLRAMHSKKRAAHGLALGLIISVTVNFLQRPGNPTTQRPVSRALTTSQNVPQGVALHKTQAYWSYKLLSDILVLCGRSFLISYC